MNPLCAAWNWYTTVETSAYWNQDEGSILAVIVGLAAVIWTGGLIAYQIKKYGLARTFGLNFAQTAFMFALVSMFMDPLAFRYVITAFGLLYTVLSLRYIWLYRNLEWTSKRSTWFDKRTWRQRYTLEDGQWEKISMDARLSSYFTLGSMIFFVLGIIYPYQRSVVWIATACTFLAYQIVIWVFNNLEDNAGIQNLLTTQVQTRDALSTANDWLQVISLQLSAILGKLP